MNKTGKIVLAVVVVAAVVAAAVLLGTSKSTKTLSGSLAADGSSQSRTTVVVVAVTDNGFDPSSVTLKAGDKLTFLNNTKATVQPASNPHPVHTDNPQLNAGDIAPGKSKTLVLTTKGTWGFHNHYNPDTKGQVIVK